MKAAICEHFKLDMSWISHHHVSKHQRLPALLNFSEIPAMTNSALQAAIDVWKHVDDNSQNGVHIQFEMCTNFSFHLFVFFGLRVFIWPHLVDLTPVNKKQLGFDNRNQLANANTNWQSQQPTTNHSIRKWGPSKTVATVSLNSWWSWQFCGTELVIKLNWMVS